MPIKFPKLQSQKKEELTFAQRAEAARKQLRQVEPPKHSLGTTICVVFLFIITFPISLLVLVGYLFFQSMQQPKVVYRPRNTYRRR